MWEQVRANQRRSIFLVWGMAILLAAVGYALGVYLSPESPWIGLILALILWVILAAVARKSGDSLLLSIARARRIEKHHHPVLFNVVEEMSIAAGLAQMPTIYIIDDPAPNALATGRDPRRAAVAVTTGLLERLSRIELQGVVAHELGHVKNRDVLFMTRLTVMAGAIVLLADIVRRMLWFGGGSRRRTSLSREGGQGAAVIAVVAIVLLILAPIAARLLYLAASRRREYLADASAALFTRYPEGLAAALEKISRSPRKLASANRATAPLYIVNPLNMSKGRHADLTATHPPISTRISILRSMGSSAGLAEYNAAFRKVTGGVVGVLPPGALTHPAATEIRAPQPEPAACATRVARTRASTNAIWHVNGYAFIRCGCSTTLKVPPDYSESSVGCPHCGKTHPIPQMTL